MAIIHFSNGTTINAEASADELEELFINDMGLLRQTLVPIGTEEKKVRIHPQQIVFIED